MEQEIKFYIGICEEQTKKIEELRQLIKDNEKEYYRCQDLAHKAYVRLESRFKELERIIKHNKSVDADKKLARERWRERIMNNGEIFGLLKEYKFFDDEGYFLHFTKDPIIEDKKIE